MLKPEKSSGLGSHRSNVSARDCLARSDEGTRPLAGCRWFFRGRLDSNFASAPSAIARAPPEARTDNGFAALNLRTVASNADVSAAPIVRTHRKTMRRTMRTVPTIASPVFWHGAKPSWIGGSTWFS